MITRAQVDKMETLIGKLAGMHSEMSILAKKSPNDGVNTFKLRMINSVIVDINNLLGGNYKAIDGFENFNEDDLPTNSDVTFVIAQYMEAIEKFRSDNLVFRLGSWEYNQPSDETPVKTFKPTKFRK